MATSSSSHGPNPDYVPVVEQANQDNPGDGNHSDDPAESVGRVLKNPKDRRWTVDKMLKKFGDCLSNINVAEIDDPLDRQDNSLVVYGGQLKLGMPFPFPRFMMELLNHLDLAPQQLGAQSWSTVACICALEKRLGIEIPLEWFFDKYEVRVIKAGQWGIPMVIFTHVKNLEKVTFGKFAESKSYWPNSPVQLTPKRGLSFVEVKSDGELVLQKTFPCRWKDIRKSRTKLEMNNERQAITDATDVKILRKVEEDPANELTFNIHWRHLLPKYAGSFYGQQPLTAPSYSEYTRANKRLPELVTKEKEKKAAKRAAAEAAPGSSAQGAKKKNPPRPKKKVVAKKPRKAPANKLPPIDDPDGILKFSNEIAEEMDRRATNADPAAVTIAGQILSGVLLPVEQSSESDDSGKIGGDIREDFGSDSVISGGDSPIGDNIFCFNWTNLGDPNIRADLAARGSPPRVKKGKEVKMK